MDDLFDDHTARVELEARWLSLTRVDLPAVSKARGWPIHLDHCFQRVLLDHACGGQWYDTILKRPAYRHAPEPILRAAVAVGQAALADNVDIAALNRQSMIWRGKA